MVKIMLIPVAEFQRIREANIDRYSKLALIADMCRANTLAMVKRAGSGHLGSSFSAMDILVWLYHEKLNTMRVGIESPDRDIYFSSKGHDVPGLYSVLFSFGVIPKEKFLKLRRLGGLDGHPDVGVPGIEANSGSLGMGISKGSGMAWAKKFLGYGGEVFVLIGDGELQEGQNYEALQAVAQQRIENLTVIVDHNKVQSDKLVQEIVDLGDLEAKFRTFGWHVKRCNGHDFVQLEEVLAGLKNIKGQPKILIADTIKGRGLSFMEHPFALKEGQGLYPWHAGAPDDASFDAGYREIVERINGTLQGLGLPHIYQEELEPEAKFIKASNSPLHLEGEPVSQAAQSKWSKVSDEYVSKEFGKALVEISAKRRDLVVLDADLAADCRLRDFEAAYPERFIENGIAEQDMVSRAGGLARQGLLPVVNSFASFLASRANEQIYNNVTEKTRIIYVLHYAGLIPAGPGKSHQSLRDISLLAALPNLVILQPANAAETWMAAEYSVNQASESCALRLIIGPSPRKIGLPPDYRLREGKGVSLTAGEHALIFAYGPVMLHEALLASELLAERGFGLQVVNMPWLNRIDVPWLKDLVGPHRNIYVLEDHMLVGGLGDHLLDTLITHNLLGHRVFHRFGLEGMPACGTPAEVLNYHRLDGGSLAEQILTDCKML
jgi:transketolase